MSATFGDGPEAREDPASFIAMAKVDWVPTSGYKFLHAVPEESWTDDHREDMARDWLVSHPVRLACGQVAQQVLIPGVGSRLSRPRCARCCKATGLPEGNGSPKNSAECRKILGLG